MGEKGCFSCSAFQGMWLIRRIKGTPVHLRQGFGGQASGVTAFLVSRFINKRVVKGLFQRAAK